MTFFKKLSNRSASAVHVLLHGAMPGRSEIEIPALSDEEVAEARLQFPLEKFFVFGYARSGTTLLMRLIDTHPDVLCSRQAHFFTRPPFLESLVRDPAVAEWLNRRSFRWNRGRDLAPVVMRAAADFILEREAHKVGAKIVGDKSPNNLMNGEAVRKLHRIYPDAKLIFIARDGRDVALSHRFQSFVDHLQYLSRKDLKIRADFQADAGQFHKDGRSLFTEEGLRSEVTAWVENLAETRRSGRNLFGESYLDLRFKDLLDDPTGQIYRIWGFLGAETHRPELQERINKVVGHNRDAQWQQQKVGEMTSAIRKGGTDSWREYFTARDRELFKQIGGQTLVDWGFEEDFTW